MWLRESHLNKLNGELGIPSSRDSGAYSARWILSSCFCASLHSRPRFARELSSRTLAALANYGIFSHGDKGDFRLSEIKKRQLEKLLLLRAIFTSIIRPATGHFHFCYGPLSLCKKSHDLLWVGKCCCKCAHLLYHFWRFIHSEKVERSESWRLAGSSYWRRSALCLPGIQHC